MDVVVLTTADDVSVPHHIQRHRRTDDDGQTFLRLSFTGRAFEQKSGGVALRPENWPDEDIPDAEIVEVGDS